MKVFIDTNVFLYAFLNQDVNKKQKAIAEIVRLIESGNGYVSTQVLKEFCNVMLKKSGKTGAELVKPLAVVEEFNVIPDSVDMVRRAMEIKDLYGLQFYDSLILAAAESAGCDEILTEDLNHGQVYCGVEAANPFK